MTKVRTAFAITMGMVVLVQIVPYGRNWGFRRRRTLIPKGSRTAFGMIPNTIGA